MDRTVSILTGVALALLLSAAGGHAQEDGGGLLGFGYVSNAPDLLLGGTVWGVVPGLGGWGLYLDGKVNPEDPIGDGFLYENRTPEDVERDWPNDLEFSSASRWWSANVGIMNELTDEIVVYLGGGYAKETVYRRYRDSAENRGILGWYWVEDPDASRTGANLMVGGLLRIAESVRIQFGGETRPAGFTVGLSYVFGSS